MYLVPNQKMVHPMLRIQRERSISRSGELLVQEGEQVSPEQTILRSAHPMDFIIIPVASLLGVPANEVPNHLLVKEDEEVSQDTLLAQKSGLLGHKRITSPVSGIVRQIRHGRLILEQTANLEELQAMLAGQVVRLIDNRGAVIETVGTLIQAAWAQGGESFGKIQLLSSQPNGVLRSEDINSESREAVIVAGRLDEPEVLDKAVQESVRGMIIGSMPGAMLARLSEPPFPIFLTHSFGDEPMSPSVFELLRWSAGRVACLLASGQGYRPEIVIPRPPEEKLTTYNPSVSTLTLGQEVRLLRAPYAGQVGSVVAISRRSRLTPAGVRLHCADVALSNVGALSDSGVAPSNGKVVSVPIVNLELVSQTNQSLS